MVPAPATVTGVRAWVEALRPYTLFAWDDVPGSPAAVQQALSRMARQPNPRLLRVCRGLYFWRGSCTPDGRWVGLPNRELVARWHVGPGSGLGWVTAINRVSWKNQIPIRTHIAVMRTNGNVPRPPMPHLVYHGRSNQRRLDLSWAEVTVLEALRLARGLTNEFDTDRYEWEWAMERFTLGHTWRDFGSQVSTDALAWAIEGEPAKLREHMSGGLVKVKRAIAKRQGILQAKETRRRRAAEVTLQQAG